ncbi:lysozyme family protein [Rhodobacter ferrooxidans]|uniref:Lytic transglycosylase catalytic n=1 Tax=Rhodobacter ferrooxidans TaxID=371731 RepID=C8RX56_9RHOB|nr:hypothetical protein [Rhodobacter sp. SW2]EEW26581.1 Lytic transglycosylase catalytic [Rhodobacter sp. SW2]
MRRVSRIPDQAATRRVLAITRNGSLAAFAGLAVLWSFAPVASAIGSIPQPPDLCELAARDAAAQTGVPLVVLQAIALAETGRPDPGAGGQLRPWPWTINEGGAGHWFDSFEQALAHATEARDLGVSNMDIGCFQLNHRWHSQAFPSLEAMFDPQENALYAARFLRDLFDKSGDWSVAAGAYHSNTPEYADRYRARFDAILAGFGSQDIQLPQDLAAPQTFAELVPRQNNFPLLKVGARGIGASIVPQVAGGQSLFAEQP